MATYDYKCCSEDCPVKEFEVSHSMNSKLEECPHCQTKDPQRLISRTSFVLTGGGVGWASSGYSK